MLTWAIAWLSVKMGHYMPLMFIISACGDVGMAYYVACAVTGHKP